MIFIFGDKQYNGYKIKLTELVKTEFMIHYNFTPIPHQNSKIQEYLLDGLGVEPPRGNDKDFYFQPVLIRLIERNETISTVPDVNKLYCETKASRIFPSVNLFEKLVGLEGKDLRKNVYADIRDSEYYKNIGKASYQGLLNIYSLSNKISNYKSYKLIFDALVNQLAVKSDVKPERIKSFYDTIKTLKLIATINAKIIGEATKTKVTFGAFQRYQLDVFKNRNMIQDWDDSLTTLHNYSELIDNKDFMQNSRWLDLVAKAEEFGIKIG